MQTTLPESLAHSAAGRIAERELRACVHCGFCNANCPTYRLLGDELDGPRGRIYLIKQALETGECTRTTQLHLDRCLSCRACETTCPSGVEYHALLDVGRAFVDERVRRPLRERLLAALLARVLPHRRVVAVLGSFGRLVRPLLPAPLAAQLPARPALRRPAPGRHARRVVLMQGCVEPTVAPGIGTAAARVLDAVGISALSAPGETCCGALSFHLGQRAKGREFARRNVATWARELRAGAECIAVPSSGCQAFIADYARLLADDAALAGEAQFVVERVRDLAAVLEPERSRLPRLGPRRVAFQCPCSLQHGLRRGPATERLLAALGYALAPLRDANQCCGSAGAYSLQQPEISQAVLGRKVAALRETGAETIATANVGCRNHLAGAGLDVRHWIEIVAEDLAAAGGD